MQEVLQHVLQLQDEVVIGREFFSEVASSPEEASIVEVACACQGLIAVYKALLAFQHVQTPEESEQQQYRRRAYEDAIEVALQFLLRAQARLGASARGIPVPEEAVGGFGYGLQESTQRIDVTGHVCSAFLSIMEVLEQG